MTHVPETQWDWEQRSLFSRIPGFAADYGTGLFIQKRSRQLFVSPTFLQNLIISVDTAY